MQKSVGILKKENVENYVNLITLWIQDRVKQAKSNGVVVGMSGGIDCSVVARLCQMANVEVELALMPFGEDMKSSSTYDRAMELIEKFGFSYHIFDIQQAVEAMLPDKKETEKIELADANLRPRIRMAHLYHYAQAHHYLVVGTGNLSERTIGYFTKWGDGASDFAPLGNLTKTEVYVLAKYLQIPESIQKAKPSAGLWEGQTDEEIGVTYPQIDQYILTGTSGKREVDEKIRKKENIARHKLSEIPIFSMQDNE